MRSKAAPEGEGGATEQATHAPNLVHWAFDQVVAPFNQRLGHTVKTGVDEQRIRREMQKIGLEQGGFFYRQFNDSRVPRHEVFKFALVDKKFGTGDGVSKSQRHVSTIEVQCTFERVCVVLDQLDTQYFSMGKQILLPRPRPPDAPGPAGYLVPGSESGDFMPNFD